jgi:dienelactone hydrolase
MALLVVALTASAGARSERVRIRVAPALSLADQPVHLTVTGLKPRALARVRLRAVDAAGKSWHAAATFRASSHGTLYLDRAPALSGSYRGAWGMGLVARMRAKAPLSGVSFAWGQRATLFRVRVGTSTLTFSRAHRLEPLRDELHTVADAGFYGRYFAEKSQNPAPAVLLVGGSEGGLAGTSVADLLAQHGYPTLALAYFAAPGVPATATNIPLEYFEGALRWLRTQPEVDPARVTVIGVSLGSEAAELLGVHYPELVQAVVGSVPSNVSLCGLPLGSGQPLWTFGGSGVPCTTILNDPSPSDDPAAAIPVELIRGPLFLICGGLDSNWISCPYSAAMMARLKAHDHAYPDQLHAYKRASHFVGGMVPYQPVAPIRAVADERGREDVWPKVLAFLKLACARARA